MSIVKINEELNKVLRVTTYLLNQDMSRITQSDTLKLFSLLERIELYSIECCVIKEVLSIINRDPEMTVSTLCDHLQEMILNSKTYSTQNIIMSAKREKTLSLVYEKCVSIRDL